MVTDRTHAQYKIGSIYSLSEGGDTALGFKWTTAIAILHRHCMCTNWHTHLTCATAWLALHMTYTHYVSLCVAACDWLPADFNQNLLLLLLLLTRFVMHCNCIVNRGEYREAPHMHIYTGESARNLSPHIRAYVALHSALNHWSRFTFQTPRSPQRSTSDGFFSVRLWTDLCSGAGVRS